jgi:hypothetical protein
MRKLLLSTRKWLCLAAAVTAFASDSNAQQQQPVQSVNPVVNKTRIELLPGSAQTFAIQFTPGRVQKKEVTTSEGKAYLIEVDEGTPILKAGAPDLHKLTTSIIIPDHANTSVTVVSSSYEDHNNIEIAPSKGNLKRTIDPSSLPYTKGEVYSTNAFFPSSLASLGEPYIFRDYRGQVVTVYPFQYNPVTKTLRVYKEITVKVVVTDNNAPGFNRAAPLTKIEREYDKIYAKHFINYSEESRYTPLVEDGNMLILCPSQYLSAMQPLVDWKIRKGIPTQIVDIATVGTSQSAIRSYVANYYNTNGLTFLLLVGDEADIPSYASPNGPSDNYYAYINGNDSYPELFVGRFSVNNVTHVNTMVQRTITYEKNPDMNGTWYKNAVGIASDQGPGDDNEMDYEHEQNIRAQLLTYNYTNVFELYDGSQGGLDAPGNPNAGNLSTLINDGLGLINYTGHGSSTSIVTTGFSNTNIANLTNTVAWPFFLSVGCVNGEFTNGTCFGEAWTRATNSSGAPTGAIATFMSTINQSWNPPMEGQDEFNAILIESYANNIKRTIGGLCMNSCMQMNDAYGAAGDEMTDTWTIFGDPSVVIRTNTPGTMTVTHNSTVLLGATSFQVNCNVNDALVSLTMNGQILGTGYVSGNLANITFPAISTVDTMWVTVTAYNYAPYLGYALVIPPSGPYVMYSSHSLSDPTGNNDNLADYSEVVDMNVTLQNIGPSGASGVTAVLSTADSYVTITDNTESYGSISSQSSATQASAYTFTVANNIPDQHVVPFTLTITDANSNTWTANINVTVNAPALSTANNLSLNDASGGNGNSILDPGETVIVTIPTSNTGNSTSPVATGTLTTTSPYITITAGSYNHGAINDGSTSNASFTITVASPVPQGTQVDLIYNVTAGAYTAQRTYYHTVSLAIETFETNDFNAYPWTMAGDAPWTTTTDNPYEGTYCSRSGTLTSNGNTHVTSTMQITANVTVADSIKFFRKVSSELNWDYLRFYIDNIQRGYWSGVSGWTRQAYAVSTGTHQLKWTYDKDEVYDDNMDCAWVDAITFPPGTLVSGVSIVENGNSTEFSSYPNPFSDNLMIGYTLAGNEHVRLSICNALGQEVHVIAAGSQQAGTHTYNFNSGSLAQGVYYLKLQTGEHTNVQKLVLSR